MGRIEPSGILISSGSDRATARPLRVLKILGLQLKMSQDLAARHLVPSGQKKVA